MSDLYSEQYLKQAFEFFKKIKELTYAPLISLPKGTIIDVGCGVGQDAEAMAKLTTGKNNVIGVDNDEALINLANDKNKRTDKLKFLQADAGALPFENEGVDGLRNERLIQHLKSPEKVYSEFYRVLSPNAPAVFVETDWESTTLYNGVEKTRESLIHYLTYKRVPNGKATRNLSRQLRAVGFKDIQVKLFPLTFYNLNTVNALLHLDEALQEMEDLKIIEAKEKESFKQSLNEADKKNSFAGSVNFVMITALK